LRRNVDTAEKAGFRLAVPRRACGGVPGSERLRRDHGRSGGVGGVDHLPGFVEDMDGQDGVIGLARTFQEGASVAHSGKRQADLRRCLERCCGAARQHRQALAHEAGIYAVELQGGQAHKKREHRQVDQYYRRPDAPEKRHFPPIPLLHLHMHVFCLVLQHQTDRRSTCRAWPCGAEGSR
jgi:hypothetical protein